MVCIRVIFVGRRCDQHFQLVGTHAGLATRPIADFALRRSRPVAAPTAESPHHSQTTISRLAARWCRGPVCSAGKCRTLDKSITDLPFV
jgi:hypothetical protein